MLASHLPLALQNLTSIEEVYTNMDNPYDLGDAYLNFRQVMGDFGPDWFFPLEPWTPVCDGVTFAKKDEELPSELESDSDSDEDNAPLPEDLWRFRYELTKSIAMNTMSALPFPSTKQ